MAAAELQEAERGEEGRLDHESPHRDRPGDASHAGLGATAAQPTWRHGECPCVAWHAQGTNVAGPPTPLPLERACAPTLALE